MAQDFLSQDEIDALLGGNDQEESSLSLDSDDSKTLKTYNLGLQEKIVRGRMPALELVNERFARNLRVELFNLLQKTSEISIAPIKIQKYNDYIRHQVMPAALNIVNIKPLRGSALITMDPQMVFAIVDSMFGGNGQFHTRVEGRDFSQTENNILLKVLKTIFNSAEEAWKSIMPLEFEHVRTEMQSQFTNIATPSEPVVTSSFNIEINNIQTSFNICYPYSMLEPIKETLSSSLQNESGSTDLNWKKTLVHNLKDVEVPISVPLSSTENLVT